MNSPPTIALSIGLSRAATFFGAVDAAIRRVTWRVLAATLAIAMALDAWSIFDVANDPSPTIPTADAYLSKTVVNVLMAFTVMLATFIADEMVARGARRLPAYAGAIVAGCAMAVLAQWQVHQWLHLRMLHELLGVPPEAVFAESVALFFEYLTWGGIIVSVYVNRRTALLASARMNAAQLKRAEAQRRTLQSRLQALQARIEPQFLFNTLAQVRDLYDNDPAKGGQLLDGLIVYLRAALPRLRDSTSTLEWELELAAAYLGIVRARLSEPLGLDIDVPQTLLGARMPPMILLPLIDHLLAGERRLSGTGVSIRIVARADGEMLRLALSDACASTTGENTQAIFRDISERLRALYGARGTLRVESPHDPGVHVMIEIPHAPPDGSHR